VFLLCFNVYCLCIFAIFARLFLCIFNLKVRVIFWNFYGYEGNFFIDFVVIFRIFARFFFWFLRGFYLGVPLRSGYRSDRQGVPFFYP